MHSRSFLVWCMTTFSTVYLTSSVDLQPIMPNVCQEQELSMTGLKQPCVQAFTRIAKVWKQGCSGQRWCMGYERRTAYYTAYRQVYNMAVHTAYRCCPGWTQQGEEEGCLHRCEAGRFGEGCLQQCDCDAARPCHAVTGQCLCPPGEQEAGVRECQCASRARCDARNGRCACPVTWSGPTCTEEGPEPAAVAVDLKFSGSPHVAPPLLEFQIRRSSAVLGRGW